MYSLPTQSKHNLSINEYEYLRDYVKLSENKQFQLLSHHD